MIDEMFTEGQIEQRKAAVETFNKVSPPPCCYGFSDVSLGKDADFSLAIRLLTTDFDFMWI